MKIVIAGATGLIGRALSTALKRDGHEIVALTRQPARAARRLPPGVRPVAWDGQRVGPWLDELPGAGAVVNLAGESIGARPWTPARKAVLRASRLLPTDALVEALKRLDATDRPPVLVSASGVDYYGHRDEDDAVDESSRPGDDFLARLCVEWEAAARGAESAVARVVLLRTALVLAPGAPALRALALPFRLFLGGPVGDGRQWFSWVHLDDLIGLIRLALEREDLRGPLNAVAPDARRQREAARAIGAALGRPSWLPAPRPLIRALLRDQADLLLHGRRAVPARALAAGYRFRRPELGPALADALRGRSPVDGADRQPP
ncbi:MAG TPA: TIGR01777 family oxidoreductase [Chloroflexota bacterium]